MGGSYKVLLSGIVSVTATVIASVISLATASVIWSAIRWET
jgi:hypothetical protein